MSKDRGFFMGPSLMTQLTQGMAQGSSPMNVQTPGSPMYQPSLVPQAPGAMPDKSPTSAMPLGALHRYFERNGMSKPLQLTSNTSMPSAAQAPQSGQMVTLPNAQDQNPQAAGTQVPVSEAELILKALARRLEHHSKTAEKIVDAVLPQPDFSESPTAGASAKLK